MLQNENSFPIEYIVGAITVIGIVIVVYIKFFYIPPCNQNEFYSITQKSCICLPDYTYRMVDGIVDNQAVLINKCMKDITYNGKLLGYYDDNNKKVCDEGRTGDSCQCFSASEPQTTLSESCSALKMQCVNDGVSEDKWAPLPYATSCDTVYDLVKGEVKGETKEAKWKNSCTPVISHPGMTDIITCNIAPTNHMASVLVTDKCTTIPPDYLKLTDVEICNGYELVCTGKGVTDKNKGWEKKLMQTSCDGLYGLISQKTTDTRENWDKRCALLSGVGNQDTNFINKLTCYKNADGVYTITSRSMCPINIPSKLTDEDMCNGINWVCTDDGWKKQLTNTSCSKLFGQISNLPDDTQKNWDKRCRYILGDQHYYNKYTCSLNVSGNANINIKPQCSITVPSTLIITDKEKCQGYGPLCTDNGWIKSLITNSCDNLYGIATNKETDDISNWENKCSTLMGDSSYMNSFNCVKDESNNTYMKTTKLCSLNAPNTSCPYGSVLYCDSTTGNEWKCIPQQPTQECVAPNPGQSLCKGNVSGSSLICVGCGVDKDGKQLYEMTCENNAPSFSCLTNLNKNIKQLSVESFTNVWSMDNLPVESFESFANVWTMDNLPVYPTIDNDLCSTNKTSTTFLSANNYDGWAVFNNPDAFISSYTNSRKLYSALSGPTYLSKESLPCYYTPKDIVSDLGSTGLSVCSNVGTFIQDKDPKNSDIVTGLRSGYCSCTGYSYLNGLNQNITKQYTGNNCQYSDDVICNKNGTVDNKGICTCLPGFGGTKCNLGRNNCNNKGNPLTTTDDLVCVCDIITDTNSTQYDPNSNCQQCKTYTYNVPEELRKINNLPSTTITKRALGPNCSIRDDVTCSGRGIANNDGTCTPYLYFSKYQNKNVPYAGAKCNYDDNTFCNANGIVNNDGTCVCKNGFDPSRKNSKGAACVLCANDPNNLKNLSDCLSCGNTYTYTVSDDIRTTNGLPSNTITKKPLDTSCLFRDDTLCSGKGVANSDGTCTPYLYYSNYQKKNVPYAGANCAYDDNTACNGNGIVNKDGTCTCKTGFDSSRKDSKGSACVLCANDPNDLKNLSDCLSCVDTDMDPTSGCKVCKKGASFTPNNCGTCLTDRDGPNCEYNTKTWCQNGGIWRGMNGNVPKDCKCPAGFNGSKCEFNAETRCNPKPSDGEVYHAGGCTKYNSDKPWVCDTCDDYYKSFKNMDKNGTCTYDTRYTC